jgi:hypothetical protein
VVHPLITNANFSFVANVPSQWSIQLTGDFNGDGNSDIVWQDTSHNVAIWEMNGTSVLNPGSSFVANVPGQWSIQHQRGLAVPTPASGISRSTATGYTYLDPKRMAHTDDLAAGAYRHHHRGDPADGNDQQIARR